MDKNEQLVRATWERVVSRKSSDSWHLNLGGPWFDMLFPDEDSAKAAAAAFTRERLEEIRQVEEEIAQQTDLRSCTDPGDVIPGTDPPVRWCPSLPEEWRDGIKRTLARLTAHRDSLRKGMKGTNDGPTTVL